MSIEEHIVLSTGNGDICAIMGKISNGQTVSRGIYKPVIVRSKRVKINMCSSAPEELTQEEIMECSKGHPIARIFKVFCV